MLDIAECEDSPNIPKKPKTFQEEATLKIPSMSWRYIPNDATLIKARKLIKENFKERQEAKSRKRGPTNT